LSYLNFSFDSRPPVTARDTFFNALHANVRVNGIWVCGQKIRPDDHRKVLAAELIKISSKRQTKLTAALHDVDLKDGAWCIAADP